MKASPGTRRKAVKPNRAKNTTRALERRRKAIEAVDEEILGLLSRRMELARAIGRIKSENRIPLRNFEVEAQVEARLAHLSEVHGHGASLGRELSRFLIGASVEAQAPYLDAAYEGEQLRVLVVGGAGGMGRWTCRFLGGQGHAVRVFDTGRGRSPFPRARKLAPSAAWADLIVLAVPMSACPAVLRELAALRPAGVVAEMCSLKAHLKPALDHARSCGVRCVSYHPMFGPGAATLSGKKVLFCREGNPEDVALVRGLFEGTSAELHDVGLEEHDRLMARVLGLVHLSNIALARALQRCGIGAARLEAAEGVTFRKQMDTTAEVVRENPALYFEIQKLNPETQAVADDLVESVREILESVRRGDAAAFAGIMRECRTHFGCGCQLA